MSELSTEQRNKLKSNKFGIPETRSFPLNDEEHVRKAIQNFHHCPLEYKKSLAKNIYKESGKYGIKISKDSVIYDYLSDNLKEDIDYMDTWGEVSDEFETFLMEAFITEIEAQEKVDNAINAWRQREKSIKSPADKTAFILEVKNERSNVASLLNKGDFVGIINKANNSRNVLLNKIKRFDYQVQGNAQSNPNAVKSLGAAAAGKITRPVANVAKGAGGVVNGLKPVLQTGITIGAAAVGGKVAYNVARNTAGASRAKSLAVGGAVAAGAGVAAKNLATFNGRRAATDESIRKHAMKYVSFITKFAEEVANKNVSATSGAIQPQPKNRGGNG